MYSLFGSFTYVASTSYNYVVETTDEGKLVKIDMPGIKPENIEFNMQGRAISIKVKDGGSLYFTVGSRVNHDRVKAEYAYGQLLIELPIDKEPVKQIPIAYDSKQLAGV